MFAATLSLAVGVAVGMAPLSGLARRSFAQVLRDGGRGNTAGRQRHLVRRLLIVGQVAMALVLLVGSGLMLRSVSRLASVDPGFRAQGLLTAGVSIGNGSDRPRASTFYQRVLDEIASLPGVTSVGASNSLPIEAGGMNGSSFAIQSRPRAESDIQPVTMYQAVTAGYFETLGVRLIEGRFPTRDDDTQGRRVVWVNETFARDFLDGRALGERIQLEDNWLEIVGVVGDIRTFGLRDDIRPVAYLPPTVPMRTVSLDVMQMVIRTAGAPASLASALRPAVDRVDASVPLMRIRTMDEIVESSFAQLSFTMTLMVIAAGARSGPRAGGPLRRDQLRGEPAHRRDWRAAGVGRAAGASARDGAAPGPERRTRWRRRRPGRRHRGDAPFELAAVRRVGPRSRHVCHGHRHPHRRQRAGQLLAGETCGEHRSTGSGQAGLAVGQRSPFGPT